MLAYSFLFLWQGQLLALKSFSHDLSVMIRIESYQEADNLIKVYLWIECLFYSYIFLNNFAIVAVEQSQIWISSSSMILLKSSSVSR